jgi:hypothetical protein
VPPGLDELADASGDIEGTARRGKKARLRLITPPGPRPPGKDVS